MYSVLKALDYKAVKSPNFKELSHILDRSRTAEQRHQRKKLND